jgi:sugar-specific transcriptional regulator TrmB
MEKLRSLRALGLSEKEARVYLALLEMGKVSAYSVAMKSGLKKPTTYVVLGDLVEKGFVTKLPRARKQLYVARPPKEVYATAEEVLKRAKAVLPELMSMANNENASVKTMFFEGVAGLRQSLWYKMDELSDTEYVAFFASAVDASNDLIELFHEWNNEVTKRGISARAVVPDHPSLDEFRALDVEHNRKVKVVPYDTYSANISIDANNQFVRIQMFKEKQAVIIDNPSVARTVKQIFEMVWSSLPDVRK